MSARPDSTRFLLTVPLAFMGRFVSESHSHTMGDKVSRVRRKIEKKDLQHLLDIDVVTERLKAIALGDGEQASVASDLVALFKAKPEGPWGRDVGTPNAVPIPQ